MSTNWTYGVDSRGQVVSGQKRVGTSSAGTIFIGWDAAYAYDDIGNRTESRFGGLGGSSDTVGSETIIYTANALNQYEEIANPRAAYVTGTAAYSTTNPALHTEVVINGQTADRVGVNFVEKLTPSGTGPKWEPLNFELVRDSVTQSFQQHLYVPPVQETLTYDQDGNLTGDGRWTYIWDGENRLVGLTTQTVAETAGVPGLKLTFAYDGLSRRVQKRVEGRTTSSDPWVLSSDTRFVYDGWNMVGEAEYLATAEDAPPTFGGGAAGPYWRRTYVWGEDLSGNLQGAGGVGGLLLVNRHERGSKPLRTSWATHDLNGNVIGLVESNLKAVYEYDAFGKPLRVSEPEEELNPFRFSTKYTDAETGLCYYGYRYYDTVRGRWINRDPIEEEGGVNLYGMVGNDTVNQWDFLGLDPPSLDWADGDPALTPPYTKTVAKSGIVTISVRRCNVVILDGHGDVSVRALPHIFNFAKNGPSAGSFFGCNPGVTNKVILTSKDNFVPNSLMDAGTHNTLEKSERLKLLYGAVSKAEDMCGKCDIVKVIITSTQRELTGVLDKTLNMLTEQPFKDVIYSKCCGGKWVRRGGDLNLYPETIE